MGANACTTFAKSYDLNSHRRYRIFSIREYVKLRQNLIVRILVIFLADRELVSVDFWHRATSKTSRSRIIERAKKFEIWEGAHGSCARGNAVEQESTLRTRARAHPRCMVPYSSRIHTHSFDREMIHIFHISRGF